MIRTRKVFSMESSLAFWSLATLAAVFVGLGKGGLPIVAALAVPSLALIMSPIAAAGLLLPVYIVSDVFALASYRRDYNKQVLKIAVIAMSLGVLIGGLTAHLVIEWMVTALIGLMGALFALKLLAEPKQKAQATQPIHQASGYFWCTIAGFTSFISHNGGPPWQIYILPLNLPKSIFVGTSVIAFSYCNLIKLIPYLWLGQVSLDSVFLSCYLMLPASIAVFIGVKLVQRIPELLFFKLVTWALMIISLKLMWDGIRIGLS